VVTFDVDIHVSVGCKEVNRSPFGL
jgi:hypothetical protein